MYAIAISLVKYNDWNNITASRSGVVWVDTT